MIMGSLGVVEDAFWPYQVILKNSPVHQLSFVKHAICTRLDVIDIGWFHINHGEMWYSTVEWFFILLHIKRQYPYWGTPITFDSRKGVS